MNPNKTLWVDRNGVVKTCRQHMIALGHSPEVGNRLSKKYKCSQLDLKEHHLEPYLGSDIKIVKAPENWYEIGGYKEKAKRRPRNCNAPTHRRDTYPEKIKLGDVNKFFAAIKPVLTDNSWTYYGRV